MVFNWFRRQFDEGDKPKEQSEATAENTKTVDSEAASEAEDPESADEGGTDAGSEESSSDDNEEEEVSLDYLAWAKAAYQNVQQQTDEEPAEAESKEEAAPE
ncbi:MAG: hypothetical protein AAF889_00905, partial [Cyanobacteria bacterium P01_D01_bin.73]